MSGHFEELQGWRKIPAGIYLLLSCVFLDEPSFELSRHGPLPFILMLLLVDGLLRLAGPFFWGWLTIRYYDRTFGRVQARAPNPNAIPWLEGWPATILVLQFLLGILRICDVRIDIPFSLAGLLVAGYFAARPGAWRERPYCGGLALLFLAGSFGLHRLPELHAKVQFTGTYSTVYHEILWAGFSLGLIVMGLLDHRFLISNLPPRAAEDEAEAGAGDPASDEP